MPATSPEDCDRLFGELVNAGEFEPLLALYEPGCSLVRRDGGVARGHVEIRAVLGPLLAMRAHMTIEIVRVVRAGEELALVYNDWRMSAKAADGQPIAAAGRRSRWCAARPTAPGASSWTLRSPGART